MGIRVRHLVPFVLAVQALVLCAGCNRDHLELIDAAEAGDVAVVKALVENGVDVNRTDPRKNQVLGIVTGGTAMREAAAHGHEEILELLLAAGGDPEIPDRYGWTPLLSATQEGHTGCVKFLLDAGAEVDRTNDLGRSALWEAAGKDNPAMVRLLVEAGADIDLADDESVTPRQRAAEHGSEEVRAILQAASGLS